MRPIIVRYGEIGLKSEFVRRKFEKKLISNIEDAFLRARIECSVVREHGRIFVYVDDIDGACKVLNKVFGIVSFSPAFECSSDKETLKKFGVELLANSFSGGESFAVRVKRTGKHEYTSQEAGAFIGEAILNAYADKNIHVDLKEPKVVLSVEIREKRAYFYLETIEGPLGMPLGSQGKVMGILSTKEHSILAHWLIMKRGCSLDLIYLEKENLEKENDKKGDDETLDTGLGNGLEKRLDVAKERKKKAYENAEKLRRWNPNMKIYDIEVKLGGDENFTKEDYACASEFAFKKGALALVSGETFEELTEKDRFEDNVADMPILFPLIGFSDEEMEKRMKDADLL